MLTYLLKWRRTLPVPMLLHLQNKLYRLIQDDDLEPSECICHSGGFVLYCRYLTGVCQYGKS